MTATLPGHTPGLIPSLLWMPIQPDSVGPFYESFTLSLPGTGPSAPEPVSVVAALCGSCSDCSGVTAYVVATADLIEWTASHSEKGRVQLGAPVGELLPRAIPLEHPTMRYCALAPEPRLEEAWRVATYLPRLLHSRMVGGTTWGELLATGPAELLAAADALAFDSHEKGDH